MLPIAHSIPHIRSFRDKSQLIPPVRMGQLSHDSVSDKALMDDATSILACIVLKDELLLSILDALPVSIETNVEDDVSSKDELCRSGSCGCVNR